MTTRSIVAILTALLAGCAQAAEPVTEKTPPPASQPAATATTTTTPTTATVPDAAISPEAMKVLVLLEQAAAKHPRISADVDYHVESPQTGDSERRTGKALYQGRTKSEPEKFRISFKTLQQGKGRKYKRVVDYAFDGQWLSERKAKIKQLTRYQVALPGQKSAPLRLGKGPFPNPFGQKVADMIEYFVPSTRPTGKEDPKDTYYIKLIPRRRHRKDLDVTQVEMWVQRKTGLPIKIVATDKSENVTTVIFTNIKHPKSIPAKEFSLPKPGFGWKYKVVPLKDGPR